MNPDSNNPDGQHSDNVFLTDNLDHVEMDTGASDEEGPKTPDPVVSEQTSGTNGALENHDDNHNIQESDKRSSSDRKNKDSRFSTNIIQVLNIAPTASLDQITTLFSFLGDINNIVLYHYDNSPESNFKVCFVEFSKSSSVLMAQHLTNTVFIDRAFIVLPYNKHEIPNKDVAMSELETDYITNFNHGVASQVTTATGGVQMIATSDSRLTALGLSNYPHLPINTDPTRVEEIRRTLYIGNLDSTVPPENVMKFFNDIGEVKYIRIAGDETQPTRFAFVEYTHQTSVANALQHNGFVLGSRALKINHSNNAIVKPQPKIEIEDTSRKSRDNRSSSRDYSSRDRHHYSSSKDRNRTSYRDSQRRSRRSRSREILSRSRRSRSRERSSRRSRSKEHGSRRRSRSRDIKRKRSRSRSDSRRSRRHKSRR